MCDRFFLLWERGFFLGVGVFLTWSFFGVYENFFGECEVFFLHFIVVDNLKGTIHMNEQCYNNYVDMPMLTCNQLTFVVPWQLT